MQTCTPNIFSCIISEMLFFFFFLPDLSGSGDDEETAFVLFLPPPPAFLITALIKHIKCVCVAIDQIHQQQSQFTASTLSSFQAFRSRRSNTAQQQPSLHHRYHPMKALKVYRDTGDRMQAVGTWREPKPKRKRQRPRNNPSVSFLPELVDGNEHHTAQHLQPFQNHNHNPKNPEEKDVWAAYSELQHAFSALQASELSASTHLQNTNSLLNAAEKKYADTKAKYTKIQNDRDQARTKLNEVLNDTAELHTVLDARDKELIALKKKYRSIKKMYNVRTADNEKYIQQWKNEIEQANIVLADYDNYMLINAEKLNSLEKELMQHSTTVVSSSERVKELELYITTLNEAQNIVVATHKDQMKQLKREYAKKAQELKDIRLASNQYQTNAKQLSSDIELLNSKTTRLQKEITVCQNENDQLKLSAVEKDNAFKKMKKMKLEITLETAQLKEQQLTSHTRETTLMRELTSVRQALEEERKQNKMSLNTILLKHSEELKNKKQSSSSSIELLRAELAPLQAELKRLSPLETELAEVRKTNALLQSQISQSHDREDQLRQEASELTLKVDAYKLQNSVQQKNDKQEDRAAKKELLAFKKELADVRAKQKFAVNEVKVLMAKLATQNSPTSGGGAIDLIDENLARLKKKKLGSGKTGKRPKNTRRK